MRTNYDIQTTYDSAAITAMTRMTYDLFHPQVSGRLLVISFAMLLAGGVGAGAVPRLEEYNDAVLLCLQGEYPWHTTNEGGK